MRYVRNIIELYFPSYLNVDQSAHLHSILLVDTDGTIGHARVIYEACVSVQVLDYTSICLSRFERVRFQPAPFLIFTEVVIIRSQPYEEFLIIIYDGDESRY